MPTTEQIRHQRIQQLFTWAKDIGTTHFDTIYQHARMLFPRVRKQTVHDYAEAVLRMLKITEKKKNE